VVRRDLLGQGSALLDTPPDYTGNY
jgi:hypothetical protein